MNTEAMFSFSRAHARAVAWGMGHDESLGYALAAEWASREPQIDRDNLLAGLPGSSSLVQLNTNGLTCAADLPAALIGTPSEAEARETIALWQPRTTAARFEQAKKHTFTPEELISLSEPSLGWGGGWGGHAILDYERILREGPGALAARIQSHLNRVLAQPSPDPRTIDWYRGMLHTSRGITQFIANHATRARLLADRAADPELRQHYQAIADSCTHIACDGAETFRDAVQLFYFIHVLDGTDSPGRLDQFLWPYYAAASPDPAERYSLARPILESLWQRFIACRSWNVCLAGQTPDGRDATNELTWLFLDLQAHFRREAPNLSVRFFRGSPPRLMERCVEVISLGTGLPALYNDEVIIPALVDLGIPLHHARNYALNGCMQIDIQGMSHMGLEDGELSLAKCLELALHAGKSAITHKQVGPATLPLTAIHDLPTLRAQLQEQIEYCSEILTRCANLFQQVIAETAPHLFRSLFIADCIERGKDMKRGGPLYNHGQFLTEGVANTGDSLYTIEHLVFQEHRCTLPQLVQILDSNWQGHEHLRKYITERLPKYGTDCEEVDRLTAETLEGYFRHLHTLRTWRGGIYSGGLSTFNRAPGYGRHLAASADGRLSGETVADSTGPAPGRDRHGPTAMLRSVARLPHHLAASGFALNVKLSPSIFASRYADAGAGTRPCQKIASLFCTYFDMGGQQLQANVVNARTLREAQAHPDEHRNLIVRVGGFSARFVDLERAQQDDIIARTEHQ